MDTVRISPEEYIIKEGSIDDSSIYIIYKGTVELEFKNKCFKKL